MAALTCCGNQPTPIIIGLLVTYLTGLIDCYPLSSSSSADNMNLGKIVYRPNFNSHSSSSVSSSTPQSPTFSSSSPQVPTSIVSPSSHSSTSSSSSPVASQPSLLQQLPTSSYHHLPSSSSVPGIAFIRGPVADDDVPMSIINRRPVYQDYLDTFRLPLMTTNGLSSGQGIKTPKFILAQPSPSQIDFDYVPYLQSDFNPLPPLPASSYTPGSERSGSNDLYEEADYSDPIYDLKYDPIDDSNWLNEPTLSSYRQQQQPPPSLQQPALPSMSLISPSSSPYSFYSPYTLPSSSSGNSGSSSEEMLTNLMVDYFVKELERNSHLQQQQQSPEPVQHLIRLQHHHHPQQQQPIDQLKAYEGYIEKKSPSSSSSSLSSFNRDKGSKSSDENQSTINKKESDSAKRIEQRGQKEYPMLRPATESNGKDDLDNQQSLTSQLQSLQSSSSTTANKRAEKPDDEVNQLKSLLQSA